MAELPVMHAGWDEAVAFVRRREAQKNSPKPAPGKRLFGRGMSA